MPVNPTASKSKECLLEPWPTKPSPECSLEHLLPVPRPEASGPDPSAWNGSTSPTPSSGHLTRHVPGMTKHSARGGTGLSLGVNSLETAHPLVTRWKSSLKDTSLGSASSQGPGQLLKRTVTEASPSAQPQTQGAPPPHPPALPQERLLCYHFSWASTPLGRAVQLSHTVLWARSLVANSTNTSMSPYYVPSLYYSYFLGLSFSHSLD